MVNVAKQLYLSVDSIVYLMRKHNLKRRNFKEASRFSFEKKTPSFKLKKESSKNFLELKIAGTMLYWAEGYKSEKSTGVDFANSDPDMVSIFMSFLRSTYKLDESRFRVLLYCYENQNIPELIEFWSELTNIPKKQFTKPYIRKDFKENSRVMKYGMVHIRYGDKKLLIDLRRIIGEYKERFSNAPIA